VEVVVSVVQGYSARATCSFKAGEVVPAFSIGAQADWLVRAVGVEDVHVQLAFDGKDLYACASGGAVVYVSGQTLDTRWQRIAPPAELRFGEARLAVSVRESAPEARAGTSRLPAYFVDMIGHAGAGAGARAPAPAAVEPVSEPRGTLLAFVVVSMLLACGTAGIVWFAFARRGHGQPAASTSAVASASAASAEARRAAPQDSSTKGIEPVASAAAEPSAPNAPARDAPFGAPGGLSAPNARTEPIVAPIVAPAEPAAALAEPFALRAPHAYPQNVADRPIPRVASDPALISETWLAQHDRLLHAKNRASCRVVFLGDSITEAWRFAPAFEARFGRYAPLDLGISGDHTQHLLWRLEHGEIDGIKPDVAVLMIGVNNIAGGFSPEHVTDGVRAVIGSVHQHLPQTFVLLLAILPARHDADDPLRQRIKATNELLSRLAEPNKVEFHDVGALMLESDGTISKDTMRDYLHPTPSGYERLSAAIAPLLDQRLGGAPEVVPSGH
jgi:lysophospholipase L1-like esterase